MAAISLTTVLSVMLALARASKSYSYYSIILACMGITTLHTARIRTSVAIASYIKGVTIDTEEQVSISHRSDIITGGGTNSHRSDIATENNFSMRERESRSSGGFTLKEGGAQRPKG